MLRSAVLLAASSLLLGPLVSSQLIIPGFDVNLHAHDGQHVYSLPGTPECEAEAERVCSSVVRKCAFGETECEVQCLSATVPRITEACLRTHPCAADVERLCMDILPGGIMRCLHSRRLELSPACAASDSCFSSPNFSEEACGAVRHHKGHHGHQREGSNGRTRFHRGGLLSGLPFFGGGGDGSAHESHSLTDGPCACTDECSNHLHDAICDPCDPAEIGFAGPGAAAAAGGQGHDGSHVPAGWFDWLGSTQPHEPHKWPAAAEAHGLQSHPLGGAVAARGPPTAWHPGSGSAASAGAHADGAEAHAAAAAAAAAAEAAPVSSVHSHGVPVRKQHHHQTGASSGAGAAPHAAGHDLAVGEHEAVDPSQHEAAHAAALADAQAAAHAAAQAEAEALAAEAAAARAEAEAAAHAEAAVLAHEANEQVAGVGEHHPAAHEPWQHGTEAAVDDDDALAGLGSTAGEHFAAAAGVHEGGGGFRSDDDDAGAASDHGFGGEAPLLLQVGERTGGPAFAAGQRSGFGTADHGGMLGRDGHGQRWTSSSPASASGADGSNSGHNGHHKHGNGYGNGHNGHNAHGNKPHACVRNPVCGLKRNWCRVGPQCKAPFVHIADVRGCHGPYHGHRHKGCEAAIMGRLHDEENHPAPDLPGHIHEAVDAAHAVHPHARPHEVSIIEARKHAVKKHIKSERHRCHLQQALAGPGEGHLCPKPTAAQWNAASSGPVDEDSLTHVRQCEAPPPFMSFVRHFFDGIASAFGGHGGGSSAASSPSSGITAAGAGAAAAHDGSSGLHGGHSGASQIHPHRFASGHPQGQQPQQHHEGAASGAVSSVHGAAGASAVGSHHAMSAADVAGSGVHRDVVAGSDGRPSYRRPALVTDIAHAHQAAGSGSSSHAASSGSGSSVSVHDSHDASRPWTPGIAAPHGYAPAAHQPASSKGTSYRSTSSSSGSGATSWLTSAAAKALVGEASHELLLLYGIYALVALTVGFALGICWCIVAARRRQAFGAGSHYAKDASRIRLGAMCQACGRCCALDRLCPSVFGGRPSGLPLTNAAAAAAAAATVSAKRVDAE